MSSTPGILPNTIKSWRFFRKTTGSQAVASLDKLATA